MKNCEISISLVPVIRKCSRGPLSREEMIPGKYYTKARTLKLFELGRHSIYKCTELRDEKKGVACICYPFGANSCEPYLRWAEDYSFYEIDIEEMKVHFNISQVGDESV